jgi:hypothetical protein
VTIANLYQWDERIEFIEEGDLVRVSHFKRTSKKDTLRFTTTMAPFTAGCLWRTMRWSNTLGWTEVDTLGIHP